MQEGIDYILVNANSFKTPSGWTCDQCNLSFCPSNEYTYDITRLHIPKSDQCKNLNTKKICWRHEYGMHILLKCTQCPKNYTTKNIDYIGARSIFTEPSFTTMCNCDNAHYEHICDENS